MKILFVLLLSAVFTFLNASAIGTVQKAQGNVKVKQEGSIKKMKVKSGYEIQKGDLISTTRRASAVIKLADNSTIVLDEKSSVHFNSKSDASQESGKIYYKITSRNAANSLKIKTPFAIIGIKGTTFVVNATENASVTLKEGLIGVASIQEEFNLYRKKLEEEFNKFKSDMNADFEKFKSKQNGYLPPVKTKEFDLKEGNRISFNGNNVHEDTWSKDDDAEFSHFEALINSNIAPSSDVSQEQEETQEAVPTAEVQQEVKAQPQVEAQESDSKQSVVPQKTQESEDDGWSDDDDAELDQIGIVR